MNQQPGNVAIEVEIEDVTDRSWRGCQDGRGGATNLEGATRDRIVGCGPGADFRKRAQGSAALVRAARGPIQSVRSQALPFTTTSLDKVLAAQLTDA
jgi:hypothetical protein